MGDYADDLIDGTCDWSGDYTYKDNVNHNYRKRRYFPETQAEKNIRAVRKELAILIKKKKRDNPDANVNVLVDEARKEINLKYGKGWRERGFVSNDPDQWKDLSEY